MTTAETREEIMSVVLKAPSSFLLNTTLEILPLGKFFSRSSFQGFSASFAGNVQLF